MSKTATTNYRRTTIAQVVGGDEYGFESASEMRCPCCRGMYVSSGTPKTIHAGTAAGEEPYRAGWGGRGPLLIVPFSGECGSEWDVCFGFHKGMTFTFVRVRVDCRRAKPCPPRKT